jgi:transglutaminase-like putative cysteine protease
MKDRPRFLSAFLAVSWSRASLRFVGLKRTVRLARWLGARVAKDRVRGTPDKIGRSVAVAAAFFPGRAVCLEQSVALYVLLRRYGHPATIRVGVQPYPFRAHAWVEVEGRPILEDADDLTLFVPFPEALT